MPIYEYKCINDHRFEFIGTWANSQNPINCPACDEIGVKIPSLASIKPDKHWHKGFYNPAVNKHFNNQKEMDTYYKQNKLEIVKAGECKIPTREERIKELQEKNDAKLEKVVAKVVNDYVP